MTTTGRLYLPSGGALRARQARETPLQLAYYLHTHARRRHTGLERWNLPKRLNLLMACSLLKHKDGMLFGMRAMVEEESDE